MTESLRTRSQPSGRYCRCVFAVLLVLAASAAWGGSTVRATTADLKVVANTGYGDAGEVGNLDFRPAVSADGRFVAWVSLTPFNSTPLYLRDLRQGFTKAITPPGDDPSEAVSASETPVLSATGRYLAFASNNTALSSEDRDRIRTLTGSDIVHDIFVYDRRTKMMRLVSRRSGRHGTSAEDSSSRPSISDDGAIVAYATESWNLSPPRPPRPGGVYARDLRSETNRRVSAVPGIQFWHPASFFPDVSGDGRRVAFGFQYSPHPYDPKHPPKNIGRWLHNRHKQIMLWDPSWKKPRLVSRASGRRGRIPNENCTGASASGTGRFVAFTCEATNLVPGDDNGVKDVFVRDTKLNLTTLVSSPATSAIADGDSNRPSISANGRYVVFQSLAANLVRSDKDKKIDVFLKDLRTGALRQLSRGLAGKPSNGSSANPVITPDARFAVFASTSSNLSPEDPKHDMSIYRVRLQP